MRTRNFEAIDEERGQLVGIGGGGEQVVDEARPLVGGGVGEIRRGFVNGGNAAGEIERDAAEKLGVGGGWSGSDSAGGQLPGNRLVDEVSGGGEAAGSSAFASDAG